MYASHANAHTRMSQSWIDNVYAQYPVGPALNPQTNQPTGNFRVFGRASFVNIFERSKPIPPAITGKYGLNLLICTPNIAPLREEAGRLAIAKWPDAGQSTGPKLHSPFLDQEESLRYEGYVPGLPLIRCSADKFQPYAVDQNMVPLADPARLYSGCWVMASINCFTFDKGLKKGVTWGVNGVMLIADDNKLGGGGSDPNAEFAGVKIDQSVNPAAAFGAAQPAAEVAAASLF